MSNEAAKAARKAKAEDAKRKHERAMARLDGVEPDKPKLDPEPAAEDDGAVDGEAAAEAFDHGSIAPIGTDEAFANARRAMLEVSAPKERSAKAQKAEQAARMVRGFAWEPDRLGLPPHCPVRPLGKNKGHLYFMDPVDQLLDLSASKLSQQGEIDNLFGDEIGWLWAYYGKASSNAELRIKYEDVRRDLIGAASRLVRWNGLFDPMRKQRGRGAWRTPTGVLVLHLGDRLWVGGEEQELGEVEGHVYARDIDLPAPAEDFKISDDLAVKFYDSTEGFGLEAKDEAAKGRLPAQWLLRAFQTWQWKRPDLDPYLILGYVVCVQLGAAIRWRPAIYPIGDKASGKSSLVALIKGVLGDRLMDLADPSGAGIYQSLGLAAIGVWADEFEQEGDEAHDSRAATVLKLARYASDGKNIVRGGQDGVPVNYQARGTFAFTGINPPGLKPAEVSRMAMPMLGAFPKAKKGEPEKQAPTLTEAEGAELGRQLLRRIVDRWHDWDDVLTAWRGVLLSHGHDSRAADTFGALLAAAHLVLHDGVPLTAQIEPFAKSLPKAAMRETADDKPNWGQAIDWMMQGQPDAWRGLKYRSVGEYLQAIVADVPKDDADETTPHEARTRLAQAGLGLCIPTQGALRGRLCLAVPTAHREVARLFDRTVWRMPVGAARGGWATAMSFAPDDVAFESKQRVDGRSVNCIVLALDKIIGEAGDGDVVNGKAASQTLRGGPDPADDAFVTD